MTKASTSSPSQSARASLYVSILIAPWVADIARSFGATPQAAGVDFTMTITPETLRIDGDAALLGQVLLNLLKNAAEAAAGVDGTPTVALDLAAADASRVRIAVTDSGPGVPPALANEVFLPFFTTKAGGTGVGLSLARQVVLLHGGTIAVERTVNGGASFVIML